MTGWLKVHRKMKTSQIFSDPQLFKLWMLCLMKASHKEHEQLIGSQTIKLQPGQFVAGRIVLTNEYNYGATGANSAKESTVWRWLKTLEKMQMLNIKSTNKYSVITITNWDDHQNDEQQMNNKRTTNEQQMNTNKNVKNVKNDKNDKKKTSSSKKIFDNDSDEMKLTNFFIEKIKVNNPDFKKPNEQAWADEFRKIIELDKRDKKEIAQIIKFVQTDSFEIPNVLSPAKLRKRYDNLLLKTRQQNDKGMGANRNGSKYNGKAEAAYSRTTGTDGSDQQYNFPV